MYWLLVMYTDQLSNIQLQLIPVCMLMPTRQATRCPSTKLTLSLYNYGIQGLPYKGKLNDADIIATS